MAPDGPVTRREFEGYIHRHDEDRYAHGALIDQVLKEREGMIKDIYGRLTDVEHRSEVQEMWRQRILGALGIIGFVSGALALEVISRILTGNWIH